MPFVILVGLKARSDLNYETCKLTNKDRADRTDDRVSVMVCSTGEEVWARPENTRPVHTHPKMPKRETMAVYAAPLLRDLADQGLDMPVLVEVKPVEGATLGMCHINVENALQDDDEPVFGYELTVSRRCYGCVNFAAHSVLRRNGQLIDISPDVDNETVKYFVEDPMIEHLGKRSGRSDKVGYASSRSSSLITPFVCESVPSRRLSLWECSNKHCAPMHDKPPAHSIEGHFIQTRLAFLKGAHDRLVFAAEADGEQEEQVSMLEWAVRSGMAIEQM
jgi:hypothetical protein